MSIINAASAAISDIQIAVNSSTYGDAIIVPSGTPDATSTGLNITKAVTLQGAGKTSTVISYSGTGQAINYSPDTYSIQNDLLFKVSGIGFDLTGGSGDNFIAISIGNSDPDYPITKNVITGCKFSNMADGKAINIGGFISGVAYNNEFYNVVQVIYTAIGGVEYTGWVKYTSYLYGIARPFYFEDNYIHFSGVDWGSVGWVESGQGSLGYCIRYNTFDYSNSCASYMIDAMDAHGERARESYGSMGAEVYGNRLIDNYSSHNRRFMAHRGGRLAAYYNAWTHSGDVQPVSLQVYDERDDSDQPAPYNAFVMRPNKSYYWLNAENTTSISGVQLLSEDWDDQTLENAKFWNYNAAFDGSVGMGCGTLTQRNAINMFGKPAGVAYWVTDQSVALADVVNFCGDKTNYPGRTNISGSLYIWSGSEWTLDHTPYTYPHPLRGETEESVRCALFLK